MLALCSCESMAAKDDATYASVTSDDGSYDCPSSFLDLVPLQSSAEEAAGAPSGEQRPQPPSEQDVHFLLPAGRRSEGLAAVEDSGDYDKINEFLEGDDGGQNGDGEMNGDSFDSDEEEGEGEVKEGEVKKKSNRFSKIQQSHSKNLEGSDGKIYVEGSIVPLQPMLSFKSRVRARSREELEQEGIYQGLTTTDEQKQRIGIMPESIYMTTNLETSRAVLENMSMEISQTSSRPGQFCSLLMPSERCP